MPSMRRARGGAARANPLARLTQSQELDRQHREQFNEELRLFRYGEVTMS